MNKNDAKRVDAVYRSIKQLPLLGCLGLFVPVIGILLLPIAMAYDSSLAKLLRDYDNGNIPVDEHDRVSAKPGELSTEQKVQYLKHGNTRLWVPYTVGTGWLLMILFVVLAVVFSQ